eukprot:6199907-Amphidinium_carterae.1
MFPIVSEVVVCDFIPESNVMAQAADEKATPPWYAFKGSRKARITTGRQDHLKVDCTRICTTLDHVSKA